MEYSKEITLFLDGITRPGSKGLISALILRHPIFSRQGKAKEFFDFLKSFYNFYSIQSHSCILTLSSNVTYPFNFNITQKSQS